MLAVTGCGDDGSGGTNGDGGTTGPDAMYNPPNPMGLGPAPVDAGTAGTFVILAKTGVTNVTGSMITGGDVGASPVTATAITGFDLMAHASNVYSTSASVIAPAKVYASNYAVPTPANLTAAISNMELAYTDAAGRTHPNFINLHTGNLGGQTLVPGLYRWGTTVTIPTNMTIAGGASDVWIFQITNDLDLSAATTMLLSGGAEARNIYWQVAGKVTIHENAHFEGIILSKTGITMQTTASLNGRALAQTLVALDNNAIDAP